MRFRLEFPHIAERKEYPDTWEQEDLMMVARQLSHDPRIVDDGSKSLIVLSIRETDGEYYHHVGITKGRALPVYDVRFWKRYLPIAIQQDNCDWAPSLLKQVRTWEQTMQRVKDRLEVLNEESRVVSAYGKETLNFSHAFGRKVSGDLTQAFAIEHAETITERRNKLVRRKVSYTWIMSLLDYAITALSDNQRAIVEATYFGPSMDRGLVAAILKFSLQDFNREHDAAIRKFADKTAEWVRSNLKCS